MSEAEYWHDEMFAAEQRGAEAERAKIVAWLRNESEIRFAEGADDIGVIWSRAADQIERGEHLK